MNPAAGVSMKDDEILEEGYSVKDVKILEILVMSLS